MSARRFLRPSLPLKQRDNCGDRALEDVLTVLSTKVVYGQNLEGYGNQSIGLGIPID